jgi:hypothetical protein
MIKKIHYCWFGGPEPDVVKRNVAAWAEMNPDFEIIRWSEDNFDIEAYDFARRARDEKKWAFVSDIARLKALLEHGGFYLDTDVELYRPFSALDKVAHKLLIGYLYDCAFGTAVLYAPKNHAYLADILTRYDLIRDDCRPVNNTIFTEYFINHVPDFLLNGREWENDQAHVFRKTMFENPSFIRNRGISIHHCCGSWMVAGNNSDPTGSRGWFHHKIKWVKRVINTYRALKVNEFYPVYHAARNGRNLEFKANYYR